MTEKPGGNHMASKKVGTLIKEARTEAGLTQEQLARRISGLSASDISQAERHQKNLTQDQLKQIAKITGVTQASLLNAAKGTSSKKSSSKTSMQLTAAEKKLVELYRAADSDTKKSALKVLKGENSLAGDLLESLLGGGKGDNLLESVLDSVQDALEKK
ncbi:MAG: helix-turn-helix domain-containing protein [Ruminococcaceae bacterium]|nr:helix-turn-helix domain-containing protein [Oscillospiraceae bacterium]